jgi:hypothetical protein
MGKPGNKKGKKGEYEWSGEISRIIPLRNNYCYVQDEKGKLHHIKRDSTEFYALAKHLNEIMEGKITRELEQLGWTEQIEVLT